MTVRHRQKEFDDAILRPYGMTKRIATAYYADECDLAIVSGMPEGIGKTSYIHHVLADTYGYVECHDQQFLNTMWLKQEERLHAQKWPTDWEAIKRFVLYLPEDVVNLCQTMLQKKRREPAFHWDDAGSWLNSMDYNDPFVVSFMKYLGLARSNWGMVILSTPVKGWILKKLRSAEGMLQVKIVKPEGKSSLRSIWKPRIAKAYKMVSYVGKAKSYWPRQWVDHFIAVVPDSFHKWYKPQRDRYAEIMVKEMKATLKKRKARGWRTEDDEEVLEDIQKHINRTNDVSKDFGEVVDLASQGEL